MLTVQAKINLDKNRSCVVELEVPNEFCNREGLNKYVRDTMLDLFKDFVTIDYTVVS